MLCSKLEALYRTTINNILESCNMSFIHRLRHNFIPEFYTQLASYKFDIQSVVLNLNELLVISIETFQDVILEVKTVKSFVE